jgi:topoisomerase-4 subunit B
MTKKSQPDYSDEAIRALKGLDPIRLRPGQFTRTEDPLHIVQEVLDNAADEALGGYATELEVSVTHAEEGVWFEVADNGRGIPTGKHPTEGIPTAQVVFGMLYAGGKFDKTSGGAYKFSGGLHGVGVAVTNALSSRLECEIHRDGKSWAIAFEDGELADPLKSMGKSAHRGTRVRFRPNPKYFVSATVPVPALRELARNKAILLPGLRVKFSVDGVAEDWCYENGMASWLADLGEPLVTPVFHLESYASKDDPDMAEGEGAAVALAWGETAGQGKGFVNLIHTPEGGTHVAGLRAAVGEAVKGYLEHHSLMPKNLRVTPEDAFANVSFVLSARMLDPSFDNQTKDRLNSREGAKLVANVVKPWLEGLLAANPMVAKLIAELTLRNAAARQRQAQKNVPKRLTGVVTLPGKLSDCESEDLAETELFIVEGDSAGGSAKQGRNKDFQAILPLKGKSLNTWEKTADEAGANTEVDSIAKALGIPLHSDPNAAYDTLRYGKVIILADADVDGFHIQTLVLTLLFRHAPSLIRSGRVFVACPPLYRLDVEASGKKRPAKKIYAMNNRELQAWTDRLTKEGYSKWTLGRFKGLGEMNPEELWETVLNPDTRTLLKVDAHDMAASEDMLNNLMSKSRVAWRRAWMETRSKEIEND